MPNLIAASSHARLIVAINATLIIVLSSGCAAGPAPYFQMGMGVTVSEDELFKNPNHGRDPTAHLAIGVEGQLSCIKVNHLLYIEWDHWSHYRDGGPFNDYPETYKDEIEAGFKIGGIK